jgi:hypothetical protein
MDDELYNRGGKLCGDKTRRASEPPMDASATARYSAQLRLRVSLIAEPARPRQYVTGGEATAGEGPGRPRHHHHHV